MVPMVACLLTELGLANHILDLAVDQVVVADVREAMGYAASIVHDDPSRAMRMVAITESSFRIACLP